MSRRPFAIAALVAFGFAATARADEGTSQLLAGHHSEGVPKPGYLDWIGTTGIDGRGVKISIIDTGVDGSHPDLDDRPVEEINYDTAPNPMGDVDEQGHGTHVAGIVAGRPDVDETTAFRDAAGFLYGMGVAPGAELVAQNGIGLDAFMPDFFMPDLIPMLARDAVRAGAVAWNASWHTGEGAGRGYKESARLVDELVRDADREKPGLQPLIMVFSAGNEGGDEHRITAPKEGKNLIVVASSKGQRAGNTEEVSTFSSRGPARDGRIVPTVTAPGETIASARSKPMGGLCFEPADVSPIHSTCSGTSMAAPHVAGAVALVTQWWRSFNGGTNPSPAMAKALLVNTAVDLGDADIPNGVEGWGRVDLGRLFTGPERIYADQQQPFTTAGDAHTWRVRPVDPARPMRVTLAWTDVPGRPVPAEDPSDEDLARPVLVNDLDLTVTAPDGTAFLGNRFDTGRSVPGGAANRLDNLENVFLDTAGDGEYIVSVGAHALNGDGVPGAGDATDQDYAIVISNARAVPARPAPIAAPAPAGIKIVSARRRTSRRVAVRLHATGASLRNVKVALRSGRRTLATRRLSRLGTKARTVTLRLRRRAPRRLKVFVSGTRADRSRVAVARRVR